MNENSTTVWTADQIAEAREWLMDLEFMDLDPDEIQWLTPLVVVRAVQHHYDGGWEAFLRDFGFVEEYIYRPYHRKDCPQPWFHTNAGHVCPE